MAYSSTAIPLWLFLPISPCLLVHASLHRAKLGLLTSFALLSKVFTYEFWPFMEFLLIFPNGVNKFWIFFQNIEFTNVSQDIASGPHLSALQDCMFS